MGLNDFSNYIRAIKLRSLDWTLPQRGSWNMTTVVNLRNEDHDVYIGRGSIWGNPFRIGPDGSRSDVIRKYRDYILKAEHLMSRLPSLKGKRLGCYCAPKPCHGDILIDLIENPGLF